MNDSTRKLFQAEYNATCGDFLTLSNDIKECKKKIEAIQGNNHLKNFILDFCKKIDSEGIFKKVTGYGNTFCDTLEKAFEEYEKTSRLPAIFLDPLIEKFANLTLSENTEDDDNNHKIFAFCKGSYFVRRNNSINCNVFECVSKDDGYTHYKLINLDTGGIIYAKREGEFFLKYPHCVLLPNNRENFKELQRQYYEFLRNEDDFSHVYSYLLEYVKKYEDK